MVSISKQNINIEMKKILIMKVVPVGEEGETAEIA
jgi:hypothetical protein